MSTSISCVRLTAHHAPAPMHVHLETFDEAASLMLQEHCTRNALRIWERHAKDHQGAPGSALMPLLLDDYKVGSELLFVGMNPSFSLNAIRRILDAEFPGEKRDIETFFAWDTRRRVDELVRFESKARCVYKKFFKPLENFAQAAGAQSHAHIDMFLMRHTKQNQVTKAYGKGFSELSAKPFMVEQFDLFKHTLEAMRPKVVVVANAGASSIARIGLDLKSPDGGRTYRWSAMPNVFIFLSGMLSGQRALDIYSTARLALDVRAALVAAEGAPSAAE
jgi:hypothetical protein